MSFTKMTIEIYDEEGGTLSTIELNQRCDSCDGSGIVADRETRTFSDCADCGSTGERLTYPGQDILRFVRDHADHPDIDNENLP